MAHISSDIEIWDASSDAQSMYNVQSYTCIQKKHTYAINWSNWNYLFENVPSDNGKGFRLPFYVHLNSVMTWLDNMNEDKYREI